MGFLWFLLAVIFFIAWWNARSKNNSSRPDSYAYGYWDGYRAFGDKAKELLNAPTVSKSRLSKLINEGEGIQSAPDEPQEAYEQPQTPVPRRTEMLGAIDEDVDYLEDEPVRSFASSVAPAQQQVVSEELIEPQVWQQNEPAETTAPQPQLSPEALQREKERVTLRNLNTMLYMGSFLLVAAAAALIAAAMPEMVKLIGLISVVVLFYGAGVVLYRRAPRLRPAAVAFVGTGLAILPFVGVALTLLGGVSETTAWFAISLIGLAAYAYASMVLQSQVVSYLTMAFVLSLASAAVATVSLPIIWYFIVLIAISLAASSVSYLWPKRVPQIFRQPVETTGQVVTPVAIVASVFVARDMSLFMYEVLFGLGTAHYLVVWLQRRQLLYETVVRVLAHITLLIVGWDLLVTAEISNLAWFGLWWCGLAVGQFAYSCWRIVEQSEARRQAETVWLVLTQIGLVIAPVFWVANSRVELFTTINLFVLGLVSVVAAIRLRRPTWGYVGLAASWLLPLALGQWVVAPSWPWSVMVGIYVVLACASLAGYMQVRDVRSKSLQQFFVAAVVVYGVTIALSGVWSQDATVLGWSLSLAGALWAAFSYATRAKYVEIIAAVSVASAFIVWVAASDINNEWRGLVAILLASAVVGVGALAHQLLRDDTWRRNALLVTAMVYFGCMWLVVQAATVTVVQVALVLFVVATVAHLGLRIWTLREGKSDTLQSISAAGYFVYLLLAVLLTFDLNNAGWSVLVYAVAALVFWVGAHAERRRAMTVVGNISLFIAVYTFWQWREFDTQWATFGVLWIVAAVLYGLYWLYVQSGDKKRQWIQLLSVWTLLLITAVYGGLDTTAQVVSSIATLVISAAVIVFHQYASKQEATSPLRTTVGVTTVLYLCAAFVLIGNDTNVAAWALAITSVFAVWYSYLARHVAAELVGAVIGVGAVAAWLSLAPLEQWYSSVVVVVASLLILLVSGLHHILQGQNDRRDGMLAVAMIVFGGFAINGFSADSQVVLVGALALVAGMVATYSARWATSSERKSTLAQLFSIGYFAYLGLAWALSWQLDIGWQVGLYAVGTAIVWSASHLERIKALTIFGQILLLVTVATGWAWLEFSDKWAWFGVLWIVAALYYVAYWLYAARGDEWRRVVSLGATLVALGAAAFHGLGTSDVALSVAAASSLFAAAAAIGIHGYLKRNLDIVEAAVYVATFGMQRIVELLVPDINLVAYAHWWALTIVVVAYWRGGEYVGRRLATAMAFVTTSVGIFALTEGGAYQLLFLAEHIGLLILGALLRKQWAVWWGIVASVLAILYFIKDYTFLWLGLLGLGLIALVVWRLTKIGKK